MNSPESLLFLFLGLILVFGAIIFFGLRSRKKWMEENLKMNAQMVWLSQVKSEWAASDLLYGVWQDESAMNIKMMVRNFKDEQIGSIVFENAQTPCKSFETIDGHFEADVLPKLKTTVAFHETHPNSETLCTYTRKWGFKHSFEVKGIGTLESSRPQLSWAGSKFTYYLNGKKVGIKHPIGKCGTAGRYVVLPQEIPQPIRMFILAM